MGQILYWLYMSCLVIIYVNKAISFVQPHLGPSNQPEAYFNGTSYLRLQTTISLKKQTGLSFRTCSGGKLFSQQQNNNTKIELIVNKQGVIFYAKVAGKQYNEEINDDFLDNKWYTVYLQYRFGNVSLIVNGQSKLIANSTYNNELLTSPELYNDGASVLLIGTQFNGCLLEGPSLVFDNTIISSKLNVIFGKCPIPEDNCIPQQTQLGNFCQTEPCMRHGNCINGLNGYTCSCNARYTGKNCEFDLGHPCDKSPPICKNGGSCLILNENDLSYRCQCLPNFTGRHCDTEVKIDRFCPKNNNQCENGGVCIEYNNKIECLCPVGFIGQHCEINVNDCKLDSCQNNGKCIDGNNSFTCDCNRTGYEGQFCENNVNECLNNPCRNQGICFDNYGGYLCQCLPGFEGTNCQYPVNECLSQPCLNQGICENRPGNIGGYECHCLQGFTGDHCENEVHQRCDPLQYCNIYSNCIMNNDVPTCICKPEYPGIYPNCSLIDNNICLNNPCKNGGKCLPWQNGFNCTCQPGFTGQFCQFKLNSCSSSPCLNGGVCFDRINGYYCNCTEQWMGDRCDKPYDACELQQCQNNATCITSTINKHEFKCDCLAGFEGDLCQTNIDDCKNIQCPTGKVCIDLINDSECRCPPGYVGENCTIDLDICNKQPCLNGGTCIFDHIRLGHTCQCPPGYTGKSCENDINECERNTPVPVCHHGICINRIGGFDCYCKPGYTGIHCDLDFDECLSMPCQHNATCLNQVNNFECICPPGYDGKDCSINIDECLSNPCMAGSTCIDGINEYTCTCQPGLTGKRCDINIDDCESSPCLNGGECIDGLNNYTCNCNNTGYMGYHCEINIDDCIGDPCLNGAKCIDGIKDYHCSCHLGYTGKNCDEDINECESNPCRYGGMCLEKSNMTLYNPYIATKLNLTLPDAFHKPFDFADAAGYECLCVPGTIGRNCEININECESSPCFQGTCIDQINGYICECDDGFEGVHCEIDIDECEKYKPCIYGTCIDKRANYYCECDQQYGGKNCSVQLIGCIDNPCLNNGSCKPYLINENIHKFNCTCPHGYHGQICEQISTMSLSGDSLIIINTSREEGYDIQFRFKTTLSDGLLALGKGLTYYILELSKGRLNLHSSLLNKWEGVFIGSNLNDSNWQRVFVAINSSHLVLSANDEQTIYPITFNDYNSTYTSFPLTYIGGIPNNLRKLTHGQPFLVGCTEDVLINGEWILPEYKDSQFLQFQSVDVGCLREPQCNPNPCHSGGHCTDMWRDFSCTCERPYLGHTCQYNYTAATFGYENITDSLVTVNVTDSARRAVRTIVDISMFIRTRQSRGQIFYLGSELRSTNTFDDTFISARLEGGELLVSIQFNGTLESYAVGGVKLNNGYNHLIEVIRNVTLVQVKLNGTEYFRKTISATGTLDAQVLYLGGQPQLRPTRQVDNNISKIDLVAPSVTASSSTPVHFKGIIQDVQVSNGSSVMIVEFFPLKAEDLEIPMPFGTVTFNHSVVLEGVHSDDSCRIPRCLRGGTCVNTWNDYMCQCPVGYKGKDCSEVEFCELKGCPNDFICKNLDDGYECLANATFNGKQSPLKYKLNQLYSLDKTIPINQLMLTYRTRSWGTLLFVKNHNDYFTIFIYHNEVVILWNLNNSSNLKRFRKDHFEGQWLTLLFLYKDQIFKGGFKDNVLDESPNFEINNFDIDHFKRLFFDGIIYLAGSDNITFDYQNIIASADDNMTGYISTSDTTTQQPLIFDTSEFNPQDPLLYKVDQNKKTDLFKGCLSEVRLGGVLIPFYKMEDLDTINTSFYFELLSDRNPDLGCILCYDNDCFNQGFCISPNETYKCNCTDGYTADDCSIDINECENNQCQNNATCVDLVAKYECQCLTGFEGVYCETEIDECLSEPCQNGGSCIDLIGDFQCECPENFVGKQCESPVLITCDNQPCKEGSTCKTGYNETTGHNFTCICLNGMEGIYCETPYCTKRHCENGYCNTTSLIPYCQCEDGFNGKYCEINIDDCITKDGKNPCHNNGVCIDDIATFHCNCTGTGYTGQLCEIDIDECVEMRDICGRGHCQNLPGTFRCVCDVKGKCGPSCNLDDPCEFGNPCVHGECIPKCTDKPDYICNCHDNYIGKDCTEVLASSGVNILYIVIPIVLIIIFAMIFGLVVLVNVARSKRATRGTYSPSAQEFCNPRVELDHVLKPPPEERLI